MCLPKQHDAALFAFSRGSMDQASAIISAFVANNIYMPIAIVRFLSFMKSALIKNLHVVVKI